jgi:hypothetical protein
MTTEATPAADRGDLIDEALKDAETETEAKVEPKEEKVEKEETESAMRSRRSPTTLPVRRRWSRT